jgi:hypothetical protein
MVSAPFMVVQSSLPPVVLGLLESVNVSVLSPGPMSLLVGRAELESRIAYELGRVLAVVSLRIIVAVEPSKLLSSLIWYLDLTVIHAAFLRFVFRTFRGIDQQEFTQTSWGFPDASVYVAGASQ